MPEGCLPGYREIPYLIQAAPYFRMARNIFLPAGKALIVLRAGSTSLCKSGVASLLLINC
jgi:hypothetical protein